MKAETTFRRFLKTLSTEELIDFIVNRYAFKSGNGLKDAGRELDYINDLSKDELINMCDELK